MEAIRNLETPDHSSRLARGVPLWIAAWGGVFALQEREDARRLLALEGGADATAVFEKERRRRKGEPIEPRHPP